MNFGASCLSEIKSGIYPLDGLKLRMFIFNNISFFLHL